MAYQQITLLEASTQLGVILDDESEKYWTRQEKYYAIWEFLRVFGAMTNYWRTRGIFQINPGGSPLWSAATSPWLPDYYPWSINTDTNGFPWYDLHQQFPTLRTRTWTLGQMTSEIQYMCLEAPNGISGVGMSGQISVTSILQAIARARNRFVLDTHLPLSVHWNYATPPPQDGMVTFSQDAVFVHRASWLGVPGNVWNNLWREDAWSVDKGNPQWTIEPEVPLHYSEAENAPLKLQLSPPPLNVGVLEALTVDSLRLDLSNADQTFNIPDEWIHAVKYAALSDLFSAESQNVDPLRAQYAETRYQQSISAAMNARSILRLLVNNLPVPLDSMQALDAGSPFWRNQIGPPAFAGALYDLFAFLPGAPDRTYGVAVDMVQSAPLPSDGAYIQIGSEDLDNMFDYCTHVLTFKCGGAEFKNTFPNYDSFMKSIAQRKGINAAKIHYLEPLFGQPQRENQARPDAMVVA